MPGVHHCRQNHGSHDERCHLLEAKPCERYSTNVCCQLGHHEKLGENEGQNEFRPGKLLTSNVFISQLSQLSVHATDNKHQRALFYMFS